MTSGIDAKPNRASQELCHRDLVGRVQDDRQARVAFERPKRQSQAWKP